MIELCRALDGLALAIELAAARAPVLGVQRLASSMQDRLRVLTTSRNRSAPARQQTLRAALEWSHGLLEPREQRVFRRLAVFAGSASLEMIQQVVADAAIDEWEVLDSLAVLVDRSLVAVLGEDDRVPRYRLLESPRAYALERLAEAGELDALRRRHAEAIAAYFDAQWDERYGGRIGERDWLAALAQDADNAREAFAWARATHAAEHAMAIGATLMFATPPSLRAERLTLAEACERLVADAPEAATRLQRRALVVACMACTHSRPQRARETARQLEALARAADRDEPDRFALCQALACCANLASRTGDWARAAELLTELRALENPDWPPQRLVVGADAACHASQARPGPEARIEHRLAVRHELRLLAAAGGDTYRVMANLIDAELSCGDVEAALHVGRALLPQLRGTRDEHDLAYTRLNLGAALLTLDRADEARPLLRQAWGRARAFEIEPDVSAYLALSAALEGRPEAAARIMGFSEAGFSRDGGGHACQPNEAAALRRVRAMVEAAVGAARVALLANEGSLMRGDEVAALAFGGEAGAVG
ncbi:MAG TPA: hypothetical protein VLI72_17175 [Methylibium sp.]|nr:hypothetical protein [Methylibium sp.]